MIRYETARTAASRRFRVDGHGAGAWIHPYFGVEREHADGRPRAAGDPVPMVYLVEQDPLTSIATHFHQVPQFQVVVRGGGRLGRLPLAPGAAHYAGAFTGYGPLESGGAGLAYLTVRHRWDPGLRPLPGARDELERVPGRRPVHRLAGGDGPSPHDPASAPPAVDLVSVLGRESPDGETVERVRLASRARYASVDAAGADRVWIVLSGEIRLDGDLRLGPMDCLYLSADEPARDACAGADGAEWLLLRFPTSPLPRMTQ